MKKILLATSSLFLVNICYANSVDLLCEIKLRNEKNDEVVNQSFKTRIEITFKNNELFIIPSNTSLLPVTTTKGENKSIQNFSLQNKWHLVNSQQLENSLFNTTTFIIDRNSGGIFYESIWIVGNFMYLQKSTASGECEKIDPKKKKF